MLAAGVRLGPYEILAPLGAGGMGEVYRAAAVDGGGSRLEVRETRVLFRVNMFIGPRLGIPGYDVAPDGKRFLVNSAGEAGAPRVALVVNWPSELPK